MKQANRNRIANALEELSKVHPEWRFGQLVANVAMWARGPTVEAIAEVEDEEFLKAAEDHLHSYAAKASTNRKKAV